MPRPNRPQIVLQVQRRETLSPSLVRITLGGPGFADVEPNDFTDAYVKIVFAKPELGLTPPYDLAALRDSLAPDDVPVTRTYTVRRINKDEQTLDIDFVVHGDEGLAGPWAARAEAGDSLTFMGPNGGYAPDPEADWYLYAGDASALPAIGAALEALPADSRGLAFLAVDTEEDILPLRAPEGIELVWAIGDHAGGDTNRLAESIAGREWPAGKVDVFAHGERESIKAIRKLLKEREVPKEHISISGYWAYGRNEDRFQSEKREPIGKID